MLIRLAHNGTRYGDQMMTLEEAKKNLTDAIYYAGDHNTREAERLFSAIETYIDVRLRALFDKLSPSDGYNMQ
jgi:hypothetical protein